MERDKDWIDTLRTRVRDAEVPVPADGWTRIERELNVSQTGAEGGSLREPGKIPAVVPVSRVSARRSQRLRFVAAAAIVALFIGAGELLWQRGYGFREPEIMDFPLAESRVRAEDPKSSVLSETFGSPEESSVAQRVPAANSSVRHRPATRNGAVPRPDRNAQLQQRKPQSPSDAMQPTQKAVKVLSTRIAETPSDTSAQVAEEVPRDSGRERSARWVKRAEEYAATDSAYMPVRHVLNYSVYEGGHLAAASRKETSFSIYAGGALTGGSATSGSVGNFPANLDGKPNDGSGASAPQIGGAALQYYDRTSNSFKHHQPLGFGLTVRKEFAHGLSLETGVNYTLLRSDVSYWKGAEEFSQKLHFIGVPLRLNWQFFERGRFSVYIGAGGMLEKCVAAKFGTQSVDEPGVQWSVAGAAGVQYRLGSVVGLYFEPEVSYYFTDTRLRTSRSDAPLTLTLRLGMRFSF